MWEECSAGSQPHHRASFFTYKLTVDNYRVKLQVWDTAGQERFRSMAPMYYRKANAAMLVYDITNSDSFHDIKDWVKELKRNVDTPIVLTVLGNKADLESGCQVDAMEAHDYAQSIDAVHFETSALKNTGIEEAFLQVAQRLIKLYETDPSCGLHIAEPQTAPDLFAPEIPVRLEQKTPETKKSSDDCAC